MPNKKNKREERQQRVYKLLKHGLKLIENDEELPAEWARELFPPERREYELVYNGKETEEQILADTMAVPFQEVSTFGQNGVDWHNKLIFGDNLQAMKTLLQMKADGKLVNADGTPGVRLIYIDPPFATKRDFRGSKDQKAYQDKIVGAEFIESLRKRLVLMKNLLSDDGCVYVHLDQKKMHYVKVILDEIFGENNFRNTIIWVKNSLGAKGASRQYPKNQDDILFYTKSDTFSFNRLNKKEYGQICYRKDGKEILPFGAKVDSSGRYYQTSPPGDYSEESIARMKKEGLIEVTSGGKIRIKSFFKREGDFLVKERIVDDVWDDIQVLFRSSDVNFDYPTQKPEALLERVIKASSKEGDIVLDAFAGAGTTSAVAEKLDRRWIAIDIGKLAIYATQKRMLTLRKNIGNVGHKLEPKPFTLYNAGLYDFENLRNLPWEDWRFFALKLFECKDEPDELNGFPMDGKRQGSYVHVFRHIEGGKLKQIGKKTIEDLHASIGKAVGDRCYIIAPRGSFLFQEDYIEMDGVRYYALRIPYSFINELHRREFSALVQPNDEMAINETVEAVGFDFIQPPVVELEVSPKKQAVSVKIKKFESKARLRGEEKVSKHDALSMVMVDYDYNGKVFDLDKVFYANAIKENKWKIDLLPAKEIKSDVMLVFLDIYGNEARIVISPKVHLAKAKK